MRKYKATLSTSRRPDTYDGEIDILWERLKRVYHVAGQNYFHAGRGQRQSFIAADWYEDSLDDPYDRPKLRCLLDEIGDHGTIIVPRLQMFFSIGSRSLLERLCNGMIAIVNLEGLLVAHETQDVRGQDYVRLVFNTGHKVQDSLRRKLRARHERGLVDGEG